MSALRHPDWHLFAEQRFRRRAAVEPLRQTFRGEGYLVLADRITGQHMRLSARAQDLWRMLDGRMTAQAIWERMMQTPANAPTQAELVDWLLQLARSGMILSDRSIEAKHLSDRQAEKRAKRIEAKAASPLGIKIPLFDPDPLVRLTWPVVAPLFTRTGGLLIAVLLGAALVLALMNFEALTNSADTQLSSQLGLLSLALAYPVMKALHELAHCYAVRRFGGRVREFGIMLLLFFPVPYVEASEASTFSSKHARMLVGGVGILAELTLAAIALLVWLVIEPGVERAFLFNLILIGSVSTVLFNGNPLLKFDAYYVLSDWLEMPNLAQRSGEWIADRFFVNVLGLRAEHVADPGEARILWTYGVASIAYRTLLTFTIAFLVSRWFFVLGLLLALWAVVTGLVWPLAKTLNRGRKRAQGQNMTGRAGIRGLAFVLLLGGLVAFVPLPFSARGEGTVIPAQAAVILPQTNGRVASLIAQDGAEVDTGAPLLQMENEGLLARKELLEARLAFLEEARARPGLSVLEVQGLEREAAIAQASLDEARQRSDALELRAPLAGTVAWLGGRAPVPGHFPARGDMLGYIASASALEVMAALPAAFAGIAPAQARLDIRFRDGHTLRLTQMRDRVVDRGGPVPAQLLTSAGGPVPEVPTQPGRALDAAWLVWGDVDGHDLSGRIGQRFDVRMDLGTAPMLEQAIFHARRLLLRVVRV